MRSGLVQVINGWDSKEIAEGVFLETFKDMFYDQICKNMYRYVQIFFSHLKSPGNGQAATFLDRIVRTRSLILNYNYLATSSEVKNEKIYIL